MDKIFYVQDCYGDPVDLDDDASLYTLQEACKFAKESSQSDDDFWQVININNKKRMPIAIFHCGCGYEAIESN